MLLRSINRKCNGINYVIGHTILHLLKLFFMASRDSRKEGKVAEMLEEQTAKIPSDVYLWAALGSMVLSLGFFLTRKKHLGLFLGQWAPSLLVIGLYNKLVKIE